jgi:hypothetical protein
VPQSLVAMVTGGPTVDDAASGGTSEIKPAH